MADPKPMPSIGVRVEELRIWSQRGTFRVIYVARLMEAVYVLHAFQKQAQTTAKRDIEIARKRLAALAQTRP
jgi:phage-related protein